MTVCQCLRVTTPTTFHVFLARWRGACLLVLLLFWQADNAAAHPLAGTGANRQASIVISERQVSVDYAIDFGDVPTMLAAKEADRNGDGRVDDAEWSRYVNDWASQLAPKLVLELGGKRVPLQLQRRHWALHNDVFGLSTTVRFDLLFIARLPAMPGNVRLRYRDDYQPDQLGWKEIRMNAGVGVKLLQASVPRQDRSQGLTEYKESQGGGFLNETTALAQLSFSAPLEQKNVTGSNGKDEETTVRQADARSDSIDPVQIHKSGQSDVLKSSLNTSSEDHAGTAGQTAPAKISTAVISPFRSSTLQSWKLFKLGIHHIATGWDHLAFLFGLLLFSRSLRHIVKIITAFTIAHSLTLALAAAGLVTPPASYIEPAIALTIAYVGLLALLRKHDNHGVWIAFGFGLIHGFGFAGALAESFENGGGLGSNWLLGLLSFNLGIEVFQICIVCVAVPILRKIFSYSWSSVVHRAASLSVLLLGLGWLYERLITL